MRVEKIICLGKCDCLELWGKKIIQQLIAGMNYFVNDKKFQAFESDLCNLISF